ncbi:DUF262 domain-containing protein [Ornithinimicrobium sp. W1665]|uniref:DUF262 domain-containing protein n=1 Tax=Ornithinimicrobium sp. W1665 TaxID=3416666 RepID=UPI003CF9B30F
MSWVLEDVLQISPAEAEAQWGSILERQTVPGTRQVDFLPVEVVLCLVASLVVDHRSFGGSTANRAPSPVPELADLFRRPPSSVLAKMANLDGSRSHGAKYDQKVAERFLSDPPSLLRAYGVLRDGARARGVESQIPEIARFPLLPRWVGTPVSGAMARYVLDRWDRISELDKSGAVEVAGAGGSASEGAGTGVSTRVSEVSSPGQLQDGDHEGAAEVDERWDIQQRIIEHLIDLSNSTVVPNEVTLRVEDLGEDEVRFGDDTWFTALLGVQDLLRFGQPLTGRRTRAAEVKLLAMELGRDDWESLIQPDDPSEFSNAGLEALESRLERAVQRRDAFIEEVEAEGASLRAATGAWMSAWDEAEEEVESEGSGAILAEADVWPISDIKAHAERGRLNLSPSYQRGDVWPNVDAQILMESILRGIPLPSVILMRTNEGGRSVYEVIDGKQRLTAILRFTGSHPKALEHVNRLAALERDPSLPELFRQDYPAFRRRWQELTGTALTSTQERELYFPFKLRTNSIALGGSLEPLQGKYYSQIREISLYVAGQWHEVGDVFETNSTKYKLPMITYDDSASPQQIHEVFNLYNKQGKHLNAEEIRNARYHKHALMRALLATAGDAQEPLDVAPFLSLKWGELRQLAPALEGYGFGTARYQRTKVLSWVASLLVFDGVQDGRSRQRSTAAHINALMDRLDQDPSDPLRSSRRVEDLMVLMASAVQVHTAADPWGDVFKNSRRTGRWQELQLVASLVGVALAVAAEGEAVTLQRLRETSDILWQRSESLWKRPVKTQTTQQWQFIATVTLGILDVLGIDPETADDALRVRFGASGVLALRRSVPGGR